jgi:hypothetical protein
VQRGQAGYQQRVVIAVRPRDGHGQVDGLEHGQIERAVAEPDRARPRITLPQSPHGLAFVGWSVEVPEAAAATELQVPRLDLGSNWRQVNRLVAQEERLLVFALPGQGGPRNRKPGALGDCLVREIGQATQRRRGQGLQLTEAFHELRIRRPQDAGFRRGTDGSPALDDERIVDVELLLEQFGFGTRFRRAGHHGNAALAQACENGPGRLTTIGRGIAQRSVEIGEDPPARHGHSPFTPVMGSSQTAIRGNK